MPTHEDAPPGRHPPTQGASGHADSTALAEMIATYLLDLDRHVEELVARIREQMPEYSAVPTADVLTSTTAIVRSVLEHIAAHRSAPDASNIGALDALARSRVEQGFPLEALTRSIQLTARFVLDDLDNDAAQRGTPIRTILQFHDLAWEFTNNAAGVIAEIRREMAIAEAGIRAEQRLTFLRGVVRGEFSAARISAEASMYGLDPLARYHPFRARSSNPQDSAALSAVVMRTSATREHRPVLVTLDGDLVGLLPRRPVIDDRWLIAVADASTLSELGPGFAQTLTTLAVALAFDRRGVVTPSDLGPLPLAMLGPDIARVLDSQHMAVLDDSRPGRADLEVTVWTFIENDRNLDRTAALLHVHRNTVRYRLTKFEELTRLDLRLTRDLVLTWWLLARRHAHRR